MKLCFDLFFTFARIGACTFGGGYAMLPILQREIVEKRRWATEEELADYYAISQCTPGVIAVNVATFIGHRYKGWAGGVIATLGVVFPSVVIITLLAAFLASFADLPAVRHAMAGVNACVVALIASGLRKLGRTTLKTAAAWIVFAAVLLLSLLAGVSPVPLVAGAGLAGWALTLWQARKGGGRK